MCDFELCCEKSTGHFCHCDYTSNLKPEIGKIRPIVIIHPHRRHRLAVIIPFTTQKPLKEAVTTLEIPFGKMPGTLAFKECWALCDMIQVVNLDRLKRVYRQKLDDVILPQTYFTQIKDKIHSVIG